MSALDNVPLIMQSESRFVVWRRDGTKKVPYGPNGRKINVRKPIPASLQEFSAARRQCEIANCDGIGFVLGNGWLCPEFRRILA